MGVLAPSGWPTNCASAIRTARAIRIVGESSVDTIGIFIATYRTPNCLCLNRTTALTSLTPDEERELRMRAAERAHDKETEFVKAANAAAVKNAEEAALLVNGGSSVAMLAFIGTLVSRDYLSPTQIAEITKPLVWFAWGVGAAHDLRGSGLFYKSLYRGLIVSQKVELRPPVRPSYARVHPAWKARRTVSLDWNTGDDRFDGLLCLWPDHRDIRIQKPFGLEDID